MANHDPYMVYPKQMQPDTHDSTRERLATVEAHLMAVRQQVADGGDRMTAMDNRVSVVAQEIYARLREETDRIARERDARQVAIENSDRNTRQIAEALRDRTDTQVGLLKESINAERADRETTIRKVLIWVAVTAAGALLPAVLKLVMK